MVWIAPPNERPEAETLEDRGSLKTQKEDPVRYGHKYSWLGRLVHWGTSWVAPVDIRRVDSSLSDSQVGALQVEELDVRNPKEKVVVADSLYGNNIFLAVFLVVKHAFALVRLRSTLVFYERPKPHLKRDEGSASQTWSQVQALSAIQSAGPNGKPSCWESKP